ncbi:YwmB family TATA-box binding protein [Salinithrix halophila]|uniref:YwmB family TATA-box binding protein n=1 Tax=Salinithrix halophila TaxID=1485204 RepID=A0ABV8JHY2_9BACL
MKRARWIRGILIAVAAVFLIATTPSPEAETTLTDALAEAGAEPEFYMLHYGSRMGEAFERETVPGHVERLARKLNLGSVRSVPSADGLRWSASGRWKRNLRVEMNVIVDKPRDFFVQPYVSIKVMGRGRPDKGLIQARDHISHILQQHQIQPRTHFSIQGTISKRTDSNGQKDEMINRVLGRLGAREVESMRTDRTASVSAYTPLFSGGLKTKGGTMNVQAAAKVAHDDHHVILTLGTPIITIEY